MFTSSEFSQWCQKLQLEASTCDLLARIRFSQPVRRVQGRAGNVCGLYPSKKMGVMMQFESESVELSVIPPMVLQVHDTMVLQKSPDI